MVWYFTAVILPPGLPCQGLYNHSSVSAAFCHPALEQHISPSPLSPGRAAPAFTCVHCCLIISPLSGEQAAFSLALVYKYLRGQIARRENYLVWYEEENGMERGNGNFRVRLHCVKFWKALWMGLGRSTLEYNDIMFIANTVISGNGILGSLQIVY